MELRYEIEEMSTPEQVAKAEIGGLRAVATLEFSKGLLVVLVGLGLISLSRSDLGIEDIAENLLYILHVNPGWHLSQIFLNATARLDDMNVVTVAVVAAAYSTLRFVEAYGLWRARVWAEWFALLSGVIYLPLEIHHLIRKPGMVSWAVLIINILIVAYMAFLRLESHKEKVWARKKALEETQEIPAR
jgi:uncharacterized membrane protein (DUF2068 family)